MPHKAWSRKDERQYRHVKKSEQARGRSESRAERIAAATVNRQRQQEGRSANRTTGGTGNPNSPLESRTVRQLYNRARELDVPGRSSMSKAELIRAIRSR